MKFLGHVPSSIVNPSLLSVTGLRDSAGPAYTYPTWMASQNFSHLPATVQFFFGDQWNWVSSENVVTEEVTTTSVVWLKRGNNM